MNKSPFPIVPCNWHDLGELSKLEKECFTVDAWPLFDLIGVLTLHNIIRLKALDNGKMIGFIAGDPDQHKRIGWITTIGVLNAYKRRGIATELLLTCEQLMKQPRVRLSLRESNLPALNLYTKLGYKKIDAWNNYYFDGENALVLEKNVDFNDESIYHMDKNKE